jgi:hypothetical protein
MINSDLKLEITLKLVLTSHQWAFIVFFRPFCGLRIHFWVKNALKFTLEHLKIYP